MNWGGVFNNLFISKDAVPNTLIGTTITYKSNWKSIQNSFPASSTDDAHTYAHRKNTLGTEENYKATKKNRA